MKQNQERPRLASTHEGSLCFFFLAVISLVPLSQVGLEILQGKPPRFLNLFVHPPTEENLRATESEIEEHSYAAQKLRPIMQYVWFRLFSDLGDKGLQGLDGWLYYNPDVRYLVEPYPRDHWDEVSKETPYGAILKFREQLLKRGIRLIVLPVPVKASVYPDKLTRRIGAGSSSSFSHTLDLIRRLEASGVEVIDLFGFFANLRAKSQSDGNLYLVQDTHWSAAGVTAAAAELAKRIKELGWVEAGSTEYGQKALPVHRTGDILKMIRVPGIERHYPAEEIVCYQVIERVNGQPYQDDPDSSVLILGDSFLRIYQRDDPTSAGFVAHLARELQQPLLSIVNDGGASTLVRQELSRRPELLRNKKLVIWEFVERDLRHGVEGWKDVPLPEEDSYSM